MILYIEYAIYDVMLDCICKVHEAIVIWHSDGLFHRNAEQMNEWIYYGLSMNDIP